MQNDGVYNEYYVAHELKMKVAELDDMTHVEYLGWQAYFKRRGAESGKP